MHNPYNNHTIIEAIVYASNCLNSVSQTPRLDAEILMAHCLKVERPKLILSYSNTIDTYIAAKYHKLVQRRMKYEPIAYIIGHKEFYSLTLHVNKHVLIPRPETEILVDCALYYARQNARIIDIGTGSGAIAIAIKYNRRDCNVWATDISDSALKVAKKNARAILGKNAITFIQSNLFDEIPPMTFDIIVSNPPYINPLTLHHLQPDLHHEPVEALVATEHGFGVIKSLIDSAPNYLANDGKIFIEIGEELATVVSDYLKHRNYSFSLLKDYAGLPRVVLIQR